MKTIVHRWLAEQIREGCEDRLPVRFHARWFSLGNVLPDFSHHRLRLHEEAASGTAVAHAIVRLCHWGVRSDRMLSRWYSLRLGMLAHYISDFMCYAHSPAFEGTLREHRAYEAAQADAMEDGACFCPVPSLTVAEEGEALARSLLQAVRSRPAGSYAPALDLDYAASMSTELVTAMLRICMTRQAACWWNHLPVARRRYLSRTA